jgi:hypothetical protein
MPHQFFRRSSRSLAVAAALAMLACDRTAIAPETRPKPELAPPEVARIIQASGRTGLVAVTRAAEPETGRLGHA